MSKNYDCQTCGACCRNYETVEVSVYDKNFEWLKENNYLIAKPFDYYDAPSKKQKIPRNVFQMRLAVSEDTDNSKRCIALAGNVGEQVKCSIYENRPNTCRTFEAASIKCRSSIYIQITAKR